MTDRENYPPDHDITDYTGQNESGPADSEPKLSRRQILALPIIAAAPNLTEAAKDAGISEATLRRWRQDEHFNAELDRLTAEIAQATRQGLKDIMFQGFSVFTDLMKDPDPAVRFRAARAAITMGMRVCEADNLSQGSPEPRGCLLAQVVSPTISTERKALEIQSG